MRKRKVLAIFMAIAMVFCYIPTTAVADSAPGAFQDMPQEGFWSTAALQAAVDNGLLNGFVEKDGTYIKPNDPLTRAQMAAIVNRAFGAENKATLTGVADVASNAWYLGDVQKAVQMGTMKLDTLMRPNDTITRQEAFTILARAFKMNDGTAADLAGFSDASKVASWAVPGMGALVKAGYVQGSDNMLTPTAQMTRAQFAVIMNNMIQDYITQAGTVTAVASGNVMVNVPGVTLKDVTVQGDLIVGDGVGDGDVTLDNVTIKGDLIARGGGVNSIVIVGGSVDGKIVIAKVDGQVRVSVEGGAEVEVIVIDDGKDDVIIEGTVGTVEVTAPDTPIIVQNATVTNIEIKSEGAANVTVASNSTVTNVVVGTGSTGTTLNVEGRVTNVETSAANTNVGGTGTVTTVTAKEGANNTAVTTPSTKVNNDGATGVTAGGGTEVPSGSTATNSNTGGEATVQPTTGGTTGGGGGGGTAPDTTAPTFQGVYPAVNSGQTTHWILAGDETFTFSVDAYDAGGLYELEIDHSLAATLPEFSVYADESDPYGGEYTTFAAEGVTVTYSAAEMKWDIDFGDSITDTFVTNGVTFYLVIKDVAGNQWGTMYGTTPENTFGYTFERANIVNRTQNTSHASIQAAISTATSGDTIVLGSNTTVAETVRITSGQSITLDLNGKTVSSTLATTFRLEEGALNVVDTADVKGGISVSGEAFRVNGQGNSLATDAILNIGTGVNVTSSGDCCVFIYGKATLNTAGTLLSQGQYAPLMGNGTSASDGTVINITGGSITTDGTVTATGRKTTGVYFPQDGILTISGGTISSGGTAVEVKGGTVSITGGTIRTTAAETVHLSNNNGGSTYGYALAVVDNGNYLGARVTVTGGTFDGPVALMDDATTNENCSLVITGGVFSDLANVVKYTTVTSDIDITLLNNTTVTETVRITSGQSITLDLNGKTVSSTLATTFRLEEGALNVVDTADVKGGISVSGEAFRVNGQGNSLATDAILNIGTGVNVTSSADCCVFIYGMATLNTAGNLTSNGVYAPIQGNGTGINDGTVINITGGKVIATLAGYHAIYVPQNVQMNISGGEISSAGTAIEAKGGTLTISSGTISTSASSTSHVPNSNGGSAVGYALAVIDNAGYSGALVTISGGAFNGPVALLDDDDNAGNNNSSLSITGGTFSSDPSTYVVTPNVVSGTGPWTVE